MSDTTSHTTLYRALRRISQDKRNAGHGDLVIVQVGDLDVMFAWLRGLMDDTSDEYGKGPMVASVDRDDYAAIMRALEMED
jgi:hypothetical protein